MTNQSKRFATRLHRVEAVNQMHPLEVLVAFKAHAQRLGVHGDGTWSPVSRTADGMNAAFQRAFDNVTPIGKRLLMALDVSRSMDQPVRGLPPLSCREVAAAMALVTAKTEPEHRLFELPNGGMDCAVPMVRALKHRWPVDVFVIYASGDIWCGRNQPARALREYREQMGIPAKLVVVGLASAGFSIADPNDPGMLDIAGFDIATPELISGFARG